MPFYLHLYVRRRPYLRSSLLHPVTDINCATVWDIKLKMKIKISVIIILGFGFVYASDLLQNMFSHQLTLHDSSASTATVVRIKYLLDYSRPEEYLYNLANMAIWSMVESGLGIIAGSLPTLRPLLKHIHFFHSEPSGPTRSSNMPRQFENHSMQVFGNSGNRTHIKGGDFDSDWERLSDSESQRNIIQKEKKVGLKDIKVTTEVTLATGGSDDEAQFGTLDRLDKE